MMEDAQALLARLIGYTGADEAHARETARELLLQYGSLAPVLEALPEDLIAVGGASRRAAELLYLIPQLSRRVECEQSESLKCLDRFSKAGAYLKPLYIGARVERFYLLCLKRDGTLLETALLQEGTVDESPFYLRKMLEMILCTGAEAVILSHNHPSGSLTPSPDDIDSTRLTLNALTPLGVALLDHIILADGQPVSLRASAKMPDVLFTRPFKGMPLVENWYEGEDFL